MGRPRSRELSRGRTWGLIRGRGRAWGRVVSGGGRSGSAGELFLAAALLGWDSFSYPWFPFVPGIRGLVESPFLCDRVTGLLATSLCPFVLLVPPALQPPRCLWGVRSLPGADRGLFTQGVAKEGIFSKVG